MTFATSRHAPYQARRTPPEWTRPTWPAAATSASCSRSPLASNGAARRLIKPEAWTPQPSGGSGSLLSGPSLAVLPSPGAQTCEARASTSNLAHMSLVRLRRSWSGGHLVAVVAWPALEPVALAAMVLEGPHVEENRTDTLNVLQRWMIRLLSRRPLGPPATAGEARSGTPERRSKSSWSLWTVPTATG
jgi:hypothetical protein